MQNAGIGWELVSCHVWLQGLNSKPSFAAVGMENGAASLKRLIQQSHCRQVLRGTGSKDLTGTAASVHHASHSWQRACDSSVPEQMHGWAELAQAKHYQMREVPFSGALCVSLLICSKRKKANPVGPVSCDLYTYNIRNNGIHAHKECSNGCKEL